MSFFCLFFRDFGPAHLSYSREMYSTGSEALASGLGVVEWRFPLLVPPSRPSWPQLPIRLRLNLGNSPDSHSHTQMFRPELLCVWEPQRVGRRIDTQECCAGESGIYREHESVRC